MAPVRTLRGRLAVLVLVLACAIGALFALTPVRADAAEARIDEAYAAGAVVRVGTYDSLPIIASSEDGAQGFAIDVLEEIAKDNEWELVYVHGSWARILEMLEAGEIDVVPAIGWSEERAREFAFTSTTLVSNWGTIVCTHDIAEHTGELSDLEGTTVAALASDIYLEGPEGLRITLRSAGIDAQIVTYQTYEEALDAALDGRADSALVDRLMLSRYDRRDELTLTPLVMSPVSLRFAGPGDSEAARAIIQRIDLGLAELQLEEDSVYHRSLQHHLDPLTAPEGALPRWLLYAVFGGIGLVLLLAAALAWMRRIVHKRTEELARAVDRFRALFVALPDALFILDGEGLVRDFKPSEEWDPAIPEEDFVGKRLAEVRLPRELMIKMKAAVSSVVRERSVRTMGYWLETPYPGGEARYYESRLSPAEDGEILMVVRDETDRVLSEDAGKQRAEELEKAVAVRTHELVKANLELAAASQAKSTFLANMSHELRTPLNSVIGFSGTLLAGMAGEVSEEQHRQLEMINKSGRHLLSLVNDVLDLSRVESGRTEPRGELVDVGALVAEAAQSIEGRAATNGVAVEASADGAGTLFTDRRMLLQILLNLLGNAAKFTSEGCITVKAEPAEDGAVRIDVTDTGPGIPAEEIPRAFESFYQLPHAKVAKSRGFGLGLPISIRLAEMLGGRIDVMSVVGAGSTFTVLVPPLPENGVDAK